MGRVSQSIPNLFNGVSQQAPTLRMRSQAESQGNLYSTIASGLSKRPPTKHVDKLRSTTATDAKIHLINRDSTEQYIVIAMNGDLEVYDLDGNEKTVNFPDGVGYLLCTTPRTELELMTIADVTYVVNKTKTAAMDSTETPELWYDKGFVWIKNGISETDYTIKCTGTKYPNPSFSTTYSTTTTASTYKTTNIAENLKTAINAVGNGWTAERNSSTLKITLFAERLTDGTFDTGTDWYFQTGWSISGGAAHCDGSQTSESLLYQTTRADVGYSFKVSFDVANYSAGNVRVKVGTGTGAWRSANGTFVEDITCAGNVHFYIEADADFVGDIDNVSLISNDGDPFTLEFTDSWGDQAMSGFYKEIQDFSDLPPKCFDGADVKVLGDSFSETDNYYASWSSDNIWTETRGWNQQNVLDPNTMPHQLVNIGGGEFDFKEISWNDRLVGDNSSSPLPSFVGKKIVDVFFHRNRLGFLADEYVIQSRAGDLYNFWRETVTQVLDTDPIDTPASHNKVAYLKYAIPFDEDLMLFSNQTQFVEKTNADDNLTPTTVQITPVTEFENSIQCRPVSVGAYLYFCIERGDYTGVKEYFVDSDTNNRDAADITAHIPRYIPKNVFSLVSSTNEDVILALTLSERNAIYVYKYYWAGEDKLQSSWSKWTFGSSDVILDAVMIETTLYLVIQRSDGIFLEKMDLQSNLQDTGIGFLVHLDRRQEITGSYNSTLDETTWAIGFTDTFTNYRVVKGSSFTNQEGSLVQGVTIDGSSLKAPGDWSAGDCFVGKLYDSTYQLSRQYVRIGDKHEEVVTEGTLALQVMRVSFHDSGPFHVEVTIHDADPYDYVHSVMLGTSGATIGQAFVSSGSFKFPILGNAKDVVVELINDSYFPCSFQSIEWEGMYVAHTGRN